MFISFMISIQPILIELNENVDLSDLHHHVVCKYGDHKLSTDVCIPDGNKLSWKEVINLPASQANMLHVELYAADKLIGKCEVNVTTLPQNGSFTGWVDLFFQGEHFTRVGRIFLNINDESMAPKTQLSLESAPNHLIANPPDMTQQSVEQYFPIEISDIGLVQFGMPETDEVNNEI